jgi:hypothetical protein
MDLSGLGVRLWHNRKEGKPLFDTIQPLGGPFEAKTVTRAGNQDHSNPVQRGVTDTKAFWLLSLNHLAQSLYNHDRSGRRSSTMCLEVVQERGGTSYFMKIQRQTSERLIVFPCNTKDARLNHLNMESLLMSTRKPTQLRRNFYLNRTECNILGWSVSS